MKIPLALCAPIGEQARSPETWRRMTARQLSRCRGQLGLDLSCGEGKRSISELVRVGLVKRGDRGSLYVWIGEEPPPGCKLRPDGAESPLTSAKSLGKETEKGLARPSRDQLSASEEDTWLLKQTTT